MVYKHLFLAQRNWLLQSLFYGLTSWLGSTSTAANTNTPAGRSKATPWGTAFLAMSVARAHAIRVSSWPAFSTTLLEGGIISAFILLIPRNPSRLICSARTVWDASAPTKPVMRHSLLSVPPGCVQWAHQELETNPESQAELLSMSGSPLLSLSHSNLLPQLSILCNHIPLHRAKNLRLSGWHQAPGQPASSATMICAQWLPWTGYFSGALQHYT